MSNSGAFAEFAQMRAKLAGLANRSVAKEIRSEVAKTTVDLVTKDFRAERSPYGQPWKSRQKAYPWPILRKSGKLFQAVKDGIRFSVRGLEVVIRLPYANVHQYGYPPRNLPKRQYLPEPRNSPVLPANWRRAWDKTADQVIRRYLGQLAA